MPDGVQSSSSSSSCRAASMDIPDPLSPHFPIIHRLWQVFRATSRISSHSCYMYVRAGRPAFAWPYAGVHRSTSLTLNSSSTHNTLQYICSLLGSTPPQAGSDWDSKINHYYKLLEPRKTITRIGSVEWCIKIPFIIQEVDWYFQKLATFIEGDLKAPFSIATTPRCRGGCYSIPRIDHFYSWSLPYNTES